MASAADPFLLRGGQAAVAIVIPGLAGLAFLALGGAPTRYVLVNAGALVLAMVFALLARRPANPSIRRALAFALTVLFAMPLVIGPEIDGVARWLSFGGFSLHVGYLVIPAIAVLAAEDPKRLPLSIVLAMLVASRQPDLASALALLFGAFGGVIALRNKWWILALAAGLVAVFGAGLRPNLPPQPFAENVLEDVWQTTPAIALILTLSLAVSFALIIRTPGAAAAPRYALAGTLIGFLLAALGGDYPYPFIGYGAASLLGFSLALGLLRTRQASALQSLEA